MADKNNFGPLLREARKSLGMTQEEVAEKSHINQSTYSKLERGSYTLFPDMAMKICKVLPLRYIPATLKLVRRKREA
jgi:transcriptional regulator with XRE-family HTH domain